MKCKDCGFEFLDDKRYCPNCGSNRVIEQDECVSQQSDDRTDYYHKYYGTNNIRIEKRNIPLCILLSIITCGIYGIIWMIILTYDVNVAGTANHDKNDIPIWPLFVTCGIYSIYWGYKCGQKVDLIHSRFSQSENDYRTILYTLLMVFGFDIVVLALLQHEMNNEVDRMFKSKKTYIL